MTSTPLAALTQHCASALRPGETFLAAIRVDAPNYDRASRDALIGITVGLVLAEREQRREQHRHAVAVPVTGAFLGLTESRLLAFGVRLGLSPTNLIGAVDRAGLTLESEPFRTGLAKRAHVRLVEDDRTVVDAVCSARNPDLETFRSLIPAAG